LAVETNKKLQTPVKPARTLDTNPAMMSIWRSAFWQRLSMVFELATEKAVEETEGSKGTYAQISQLDVANGYVKIIHEPCIQTSVDGMGPVFDNIWIVRFRKSVKHDHACLNPADIGLMMEMDRILD
jgi:hypothetical protein